MAHSVPLRGLRHWPGVSQLCVRPLHTHHHMKAKRVVGVAVLIAIVTALAYGLGYQHGSRASRSVTSLASLRQVGLSFRTDRNDIGHFRATGSVVAPTPPAQSQ